MLMLLQKSTCQIQKSTYSINTMILLLVIAGGMIGSPCTFGCMIRIIPQIVPVHTSIKLLKDYDDVGTGNAYEVLNYITRFSSIGNTISIMQRKLNLGCLQV